MCFYSTKSASRGVLRYGDITAQYMWEKAYAIIAMMTGIGIYFGMLLGGLTSMLTNLDQNRARYVHRFNVIQDEIVRSGLVYEIIKGKDKF